MKGTAIAVRLRGVFHAGNVCAAQAKRGMSSEGHSQRRQSVVSTPEGNHFLGAGILFGQHPGADFAEYALLLAGVVLVAYAGFSVLGGNIAALAQRVAGLLGGSRWR